ncbi:hypothetical protein F4779DRAFT_218338 [Xylariaceae sp. FL0662B]|nr:hypothetical protein F4779DRAFT_218338 [Xylariaceae sp. FL0662B]
MIYQTLLAKSFIEAGHRDIESFKALEKCFDQEHRGPFAHAHFMRTFSQRITSPRKDFLDKKEDRSLAPLSEDTSEVSTKSSHSGGGDSTPKKQNDYTENSTPRSDTKKKSKSEQIAERHPKRHKRAKGPSGNPPQRQDRQDSAASSSSSKLSVPLAWATSSFAASNGKIVLFMPFLHYETDERRRKMSSAIKSVREGRRPLESSSRDALLVKAYLNNTPPLHPRRTLDQYFYHGIDTSARDTDQVVYRYCKRHKVEAKLFMVDQLWLWIIGKDLIITCFPQRWDQPKQDPLNVLDGIIEETNAKTRPPIQSVYDLAMLITSRCSGMFDRHRLDNQDFQFLDMFESSIGLVTDKESQLFSRFNRASAQSARWLQHHHNRRREMGRSAGSSFFGSSSDEADDHEGDSSSSSTADQFPDALLEIGVETSLLAEIKDIRDELSIIAVILDAQLAALCDFEDQVTDELRAAGPTRRATDGPVTEARKRAREQARRLEVRQRDVWRMDTQATSLYANLTDLLDLKQKHSNALEARFAGDRAVIAARQGQTVMVFTIVTIVFLPMSFIAGVFAINLDDWGDVAGGLTLAYVSRYVFGVGLAISIPLIAAAFAVTDITDAARGLRRTVGRWLRWLLLRGRKRNKKALPRGEGVHDDDYDDIYRKKTETFPPPKVSVSSQQQQQPRLSRDVPPCQPQLPTTMDGHVHGHGSASSARMHNRHARDRSSDYAATSRLSPVSGRRASGPRRFSFGSAGVSWARPSLERNRGRGGGGGEDLEMGRGGRGRHFEFEG